METQPKYKVNDIVLYGTDKFIVLSVDKISYTYKIRWLKSIKEVIYYVSESYLTLLESVDNKEIQAERHNTGKLRWSLVDFDSLEDMVKVLEFGANKYSDNNWKKGLKTTEICDSLLRHLTAYLKGEDKDQESGLEHTGHILCNAMFLAYMMKNKPEFDSRSK